MQPVPSTRFTLLLSVALLVSCSSPPQAPTVDAATKRPANTPGALELQGCKSDLQNTRITVVETRRRAEVASAQAVQAQASEAGWLAWQQAAAARATSSASTAGASVSSGNVVYSVLFDFGSSEVRWPDAGRAALFEQARAAPLVLLRGRTDGMTETAAESRIAHDRAEAVRIELVRAGVEPSRIRTSWQAIGDTVADNGTPAGRALNRRVEIELYRQAPRVLAFDASSVSPTPP